MNRDKAGKKVACKQKKLRAVPDEIFLQPPLLLSKHAHRRASVPKACS